MALNHHGLEIALAVFHQFHHGGAANAEIHFRVMAGPNLNAVGENHVGQETIPDRAVHILHLSMHGTNRHAVRVGFELRGWGLR